MKSNKNEHNRKANFSKENQRFSCFPKKENFEKKENQGFLCFSNSLKFRKKGVFFSLDALIALMIILLVVFIVYPIMRYSKYSVRESMDLGGDIMNVLSELKVGEINNDYVLWLIENDFITDLNKSVLEQIGEFYVAEDPKASTLAEEIFSGLDLGENFGIWYGADEIYSSASTPYDDAENVEVDRQVISGIMKGEATNGFVAKAWLKKISQKQTILFVKGDLICGGWKTYNWGEYCGPASTKIKYYIDVPEGAEILNAEWLVEPSWIGQPTTLSINDIEIHSGDIQYFDIFDITPYISAGTNVAILEANTGGDDGASRIIVDYKISEIDTFDDESKYYFHPTEAKSILHNEKSVFISENVNSMDVSVNTDYKTKLSIRKGSQTIDIATKLPVDGVVYFSDSEIKTAFNTNGVDYSDLNDEYLFFILSVGLDSSSIVFIEDNSYVQIERDAQGLPFGSIDIAKKIELTEAQDKIQDTFYRYLRWEFDLPLNSYPIIADWQLGWLSLGSGTETQTAEANEIVLYDSPPDDFIPAFSRFGYTPSSALGVFEYGDNKFELSFGSSYGVSSDSSYGYLLFYLKSFVGYGDVKDKAEGGIKHVEFEDGTSEDFEVGDITDAWDPDEDAIDDAVDRLLAQLDSDNNGKIDLILDKDNLDIDSMDISGVPYIWSTEVQIRRWD